MLDGCHRNYVCPVSSKSGHLSSGLCDAKLWAHFNISPLGTGGVLEWIITECGCLNMRRGGAGVVCPHTVFQCTHVDCIREMNHMTGEVKVRVLASSSPFFWFTSPTHLFTRTAGVHQPFIITHCTL